MIVYVYPADEYAAALATWGEFARLNDLDGGPLRSASEQP